MEADRVKSSGCEWCVSLFFGKPPPYLNDGRPTPMTPARGVTTIHGEDIASLVLRRGASESEPESCIVVTPLAGVMGMGWASWAWGVGCKNPTRTRGANGAHVIVANEASRATTRIAPAFQAERSPKPT